MQTNSLVPEKSGCDLYNFQTCFNYWYMMPSDECYGTFLMINLFCFLQWLNVVRQHAITWTDVDQGLWRNMASLGHSKLTLCVMGDSLFILGICAHKYLVRLPGWCLGMGAAIPHTRHEATYVVFIVHCMITTNVCTLLKSLSNHR